MWHDLQKRFRRSFLAPRTVRHLLSPSWILPGQLAVGRLPRGGDRLVLDQQGIRAVVSLCAPAEGILPENIQHAFDCQRFILPDSSYIFSPQPQQIRSILHHIDTCIRASQPVYVHCLAGVERSPMICVSYLCLYRGLDLWQAIAHVRQQHPAAQLTETQLRLIRTLLQDTSAVLP